MSKSLNVILTVVCLSLSSISAFAGNSCMRTCAKWDTFCKTPPQIVATKCRLGVPVKHDQCKLLGIQDHYLIRGGGSMVEGLPCSTINGTPTAEILKPYL